jgi:hypothetical protein
MLDYYTLWCPNKQGLHSTPLKRSYDQLECHSFPYIDYNPLARNLHKLESLAAIQKIWVTTRRTAKERGEGAHTRTNVITQHMNQDTRAHSHKTTRTTQNVAQISLESLECVVVQCQSDQVLLVYLLYRRRSLRRAFCSPKNPHSHCSFHAIFAEKLLFLGAPNRVQCPSSRILTDSFLVGRALNQVYAPLDHHVSAPREVAIGTRS